MVANSSFNRIGLLGQVYLNISPQVYYLRQDHLYGTYAVAFLGLEKRGFPFSLTATINKAIHTEILPEEDFTRNLSLIYRLK